MTALVHQPNLTEGLTLLGWRLKRDAEIRGKTFLFSQKSNQRIIVLL